ncbi:hypothetical protein J3459_007841 [Metarhizium acridum]|uniref:uncharacterized protein n=1 Tax=Metarhizium acridum TaxID=92637 RepID=UPI001C6CB947|nr:hypothetical protein J3458_006948 [Metarhizium acridum]KAG8426795.1 hypothetical protein J3459_007841 [Metarhizium acridum]
MQIESPSPKHRFRILLTITSVPTIRFPEDHMAALSKTPPERFTHVAPQYGEGVSGALNVFHQLHCLHADHCIKILRKSLMCAADVTPMVYLPDEKIKSAYKADFNMRRKCKNFDRIQQWARDHAAAA